MTVIDKRLTELTELTSPSSSDFLYIVDVSDTSSYASGQSKKMTLSSLSEHLGIEAGSDANFVQEFTSQHSVRVEHNLGKIPIVFVIDDEGILFDAVFDYESGGDPLNIVDVSWNGDATGKIVCN